MCLPPVEVGYDDTDNSLFARVGSVDNYGPDSGFTDGNKYPIFTGDWDGDGKTDWARVRNAGVTFFVSSGDGSFSRVGMAGYGPDAGFADGNKYPIFTGDWNGDGKTDWARVQTGGVTFFISNGDGAFSKVWMVGYGPDAGFADGNKYPIFTGDWNGDGKTDWARVQTGGVTFFISNGDGAFSKVWMVGYGPDAGFADGNKYPIFTGDWNGDGKTDWARVQTGGVTFFISNGDGAFSKVWMVGYGPDAGFADGNKYPIFTGDWNGDGKTDWARVQTGGVTFFISNGDGAFSKVWMVGYGPDAGFADGNKYPIFTGDWNGDGKTDWARVRSSDITFFDSLGDGTFTRSSINHYAPNAGGFSDMGTYPIFTGDWNGSGKTGWARVRSSDVAILQRPVIDRYLATRFVTPSQILSFELTPLSLIGDVYIKGTDGIYPLQDLQYPLNVVSSISTSNGVGGVLTTNYTYGGLKAEVGTGRGLLGFNWIESKQVETGLVTRTTYRQDWPYVGLPSQVKSSLAGSGNNGLLRQIDLSYSCLDPKTGAACSVAAGNRYVPYASQKVESGWDLNGAALPVTTSTQQIDAYGNPTEETVSRSDGYSQTITNSFLNDTARWILGRRLRTQIQSTTP
ncbi:MAG: VCBS repeat-containing protein [Propionivibrio sp.]